MRGPVDSLEKWWKSGLVWKEGNWWILQRGTHSELSGLDSQSGTLNQFFPVSTLRCRTYLLPPVNCDLPRSVWSAFVLGFPVFRSLLPHPVVLVWSGVSDTEGERHRRPVTGTDTNRESHREWDGRTVSTLTSSLRKMVRHGRIRGSSKPPSKS